MFFKWAIPNLFFFIFVFSTVNNIDSILKFCWWLNSNRGPLVSDATALPTEPKELLHSLNVKASEWKVHCGAKIVSLISCRHFYLKIWLLSFLIENADRKKRDIFWFYDPESLNTLINIFGTDDEIIGYSSTTCQAESSQK